MATKRLTYPGAWGGRRSPSAERDLIYGVYVGQTSSTLIFIPRSRAVALARVWNAIHTAKTWGEFRKKMQRKDYGLILYDEENRRKPSDAKFDPEDVTTTDGDYPSNPMDDMETILPFSVLTLGRPVAYREFFTIDPHYEAEVLKILHSKRWRKKWKTERNDDLIREARGNWQL